MGYDIKENLNCEDCDCSIGVLYEYNYTKIVSWKDLKTEIKDKETLAESLKSIHDYLSLVYEPFTLSDYCDKDKETNLTRFDYCPKCGKKIDWEALRNGEHD